VDQETGQTRRHNLHETVVQEALQRAALAIGLTKRATCHSFRHAFATHLLDDGCDISTVQELLCHASIETAMRYAHVLNRGPAGVLGPMDRTAGPRSGVAPAVLPAGSPAPQMPQGGPGWPRRRG
jgi:integrase